MCANPKARSHCPDEGRPCQPDAVTLMY